ncbi:hypothetical protein CK203_091082 [Vitis vinifera]|uniref:Uncharacterized protein n=1 Tax=Vitis vinifera TaxID=29760 RepID=A0A438FH43_VITVI|nr:hypothetical protein CK203_091082 [Vitis vinifera]
MFTLLLLLIPDYYSVHINCGGREVIVDNRTYEDDTYLSGASTYHKSETNWAVSSTGYFMDDSITTDSYIANNKSILLMNNSALGAGSTREVWGDPSPCVGPAARDAMLLMKEAMLLTAETGKQVMVCWGREEEGQQLERGDGRITWKFFLEGRNPGENEKESLRKKKRKPCFSLLMHHVRVLFCLHFHGMYSPSHTPTQPTTLLSLAFQSVRGVEGEADGLAPGGGGNGFASGGANQSGTNESSSMGDGVREFFLRVDPPLKELGQCHLHILRKRIL